MDEEYIEEPWYRGPLKWILALFLVLILILTIVPSYFVKIDPSPERIPSIEEVFNGTSNQTDFSIKEIDDFYNYVKTDGEVKKVADKISSISCSNNRVCNAKAMYYFVRDNIKYVNDPDQFEFVKEPLYTLEVKSGDCDDQAVLLASLLKAVGFKVRFVVIPRHIYVQAYIPEALARYHDDGWVSLDTTCDECFFGEYQYSEQKQII